MRRPRFASSGIWCIANASARPMMMMMDVQQLFSGLAVMVMLLF
jgi:hypothetical protein